MAANRHTHVSCNAVTLVWGSLRLTPIIIFNQIHLPIELQPETHLVQLSQQLVRSKQVKICSLKLNAQAFFPCAFCLLSIESFSIINRAVKLVHFYPILRHVPQLGVYTCYKTYMVK